MKPCGRCSGTGYLEVDDIKFLCVDCRGHGEVEDVPVQTAPDERCAANVLKACDLSCNVCPYTTHIEGEIA